MFNNIQKEDVEKVLSTVNDPEIGKDLVSLKMVKSIEIKDYSIKVKIELTTPLCPLKDKIKNDCIDAIKRDIKKVKKVEIIFGSKPIPIRNEINMSKIKHIIPISSGKGGVGKSTIAVNIARAFIEEGHSVGLLDGDIYGPNIPTLIDNHTAPDVQGENKIIPVNDDGLKFISMGLLVESGQAIVWRGPMLHTAIKQFLADVIWGELDYLFIDLPPGTGDIHLSLSQLVNLTGALIVTTPQKLSVEDVRKGISMFRQLQVDILGIIENMSYFEHMKTKEKIFVFGKDGGRNLAANLNLPFFGEIPIDPEICINSKNGVKYLKTFVKKIKKTIKSKQNSI